MKNMNPFSWHGTIGRLQCFLTWVSLLIAAFVIAFIVGMTFRLSESDLNIFLVILMAPYAYIMFCTAIKRNRDIGISVGASLLLLVPFVGFLYLLYLFFAKGKDQKNQDQCLASLPKIRKK